MDRVFEAVDRFLRDRREFERNASFSDPKTRDVIDDHNQLLSIIDSTLMGVPQARDILSLRDSVTRKDSNVTIELCIAYNLRFYNDVVSHLAEYNLFSKSKKHDNNIDLPFLLLYRETIFSMVSAYVLALGLRSYQSRVIVRGFIESMAIIYLSLIDPEFAESYFSSGVTKKRYMKKWFKKLKPSKVKRRIRNFHLAAALSEDKKREVKCSVHWEVCPVRY